MSSAVAMQQVVHNMLMYNLLPKKWVVFQQPKAQSRLDEETAEPRPRIRSTNVIRLLIHTQHLINLTEKIKILLKVRFYQCNNMKLLLLSRRKRQFSYFPFIFHP